MEYLYNSATDFAADENFIQWVKAPTPESNLFWENWMQQHPFQRELVQEARQLVLLLSEEEDELYQEEVDAVWRHLRHKITTEASGRSGGAKVVALSFWQKRRLLAIAASVSTLLLLSFFVLYNSLQVDMVEYATVYGERRTLQLPDRSIVVLNANSRISYAREWPVSEPRLVELEGEAFFEVTHKQNDQKFVVRTTDGVEVEVLGTAFDVSSRGSRNRVVLASGKVRINYEQDNKEKQLVMEPGELVEMAGSTAGITRKNVRTELYTSWKDNKIIFDNTSLQEIATMLEEVYGYKVTMKDNSLAEMKLTAQLDDRGVEPVLATVSETLGVTIEKQNQEITISLTNN